MFMDLVAVVLCLPNSLFLANIKGQSWQQ